MNAIQQQNINFGRFTNKAVSAFKFLGISFELEQTLFNKCLQLFTIVNIFCLLLHQVVFVVSEDATLTERTTTVGYINYFCVGLGKSMSMFYNRPRLVENHENLRKYYPSKQVERSYKLDKHLRTYKLVETILANFFKYIVIFYFTFPLAQSFYELWRTGVYTYRMPLLSWYPVPLDESVMEYIIYFVLECAASMAVGFSILSSDLCLFGSVSILSMHFDLLAQKILELEPDKAESLQKLKAIAKEHQHILRLASGVNDIFTPSIIFSLLSSSFIICFIAYQMLEDVPAIFLVKALLLLIYEMKQVCVTCFFGDKLMETSENIFVVMYMHDWYNGSLEYKRLVLFMMMHTRCPVALTMAGITDVSLITLKQVFSMSYQTFAVLKTV